MSAECTNGPLNLLIATSRMDEVKELREYLFALSSFGQERNIGRLGVLEPNRRQLEKNFARMNGTYHGIFVDSSLVQDLGCVLVPGIKDHKLGTVVIDYCGNSSAVHTLYEQGVPVLETIQPAPFLRSMHQLKQSLLSMQGLKT